MENGSMIFVTILVALLVPFIFRLLIKDVKLKKEYKSSFIINVKGFRKIVVILFILTFIFTIIANIITELPIYGHIVLIVCNLLYIFMIVIFYRFKIVVCDNKILYTPFFSKSGKCCIEDITAIKVKKFDNGIINYGVFIGAKKIFSLSNMLNNVEEFINMARANGVKFEVLDS